jgi:putative redox protein
MKAKVSWNGELSFAGLSDTGFDLPMNSNVVTGGPEKGFKPMELIALGLASCTAMDVISILLKKRQDVTGFEVQAHANRAEQHPKVFTHATLRYIVTGHSVDEAAVRRSIELSISSYCPVYAMLSQAFPIQTVYQIFEDLGDGKQQLIKSGELRLPEQEVN